MEELIQMIIKRWLARQKARYQADIGTMKEFNQSILLHYQYIHLSGLTLEHLWELANHITVPWVEWIDQALAYGCQVTLQFSTPALGQISSQMIQSWPIRFLNKVGQEVYSLPGSYLTATDIRRLPQGALILLVPGQRLTSLANDEASLRQISLVEGGV